MMEIVCKALCVFLYVVLSKMFEKQKFEIYPYSRLHMVVDSWNSSTWEIDAGGSGLQ